MSCKNDPQHLPPCLLPLLTRRRFLAQSAALGATSVALSGCEFGESFDQVIVDDLKPIGFDLAEEILAPLAMVGGMVPFDAGRSLLLVRASQDEILAFDRNCPHSDLAIVGSGPVGTWDEGARQLTCPWHDSVFGENGQLVTGPSQRGINRYPVTFDAATGMGEVDPRQSIA